ncbi:hypothetical protein [Rhodalgimonas zhirmunskyi]|uniref:Sulfotransferase family protein n=1 Tax=Rhodalgimonas zhirmunskyi TaxID=2964767 RepID=A0AAJ1X5I3_9RHOB|nr:hypothetical protein [Rhodoalgimonas zhirmunskyi]MDQ2095273.1 hypothetical protein [Rhodoalgimonas zhirmunskyi]
MEIIFHIGTYKTGTTTLQHALAANQENLLTHGVLYPQSGRYFMGRAETRHKALSHAKINRPKFSTALANLHGEIQASPAERVILSSESWSSENRHDRLTAVVESLRNRGYQSRAVLYLRNLPRFARSHYREWVQNWGVGLPIKDYITSRASEWDYLALAKRMNALFNGRVDFVDFEEVNDTVAHFSKLYDLPALPRIAQKNPSLNAIEAEVTRLANAKVVPETAARQVLENGVIEQLTLPKSAANYSENTAHPCLTRDTDYAVALASETGLEEAHTQRLLAPLPPPRADIDLASETIRHQILELAQ